MVVGAAVDQVAILEDTALVVFFFPRNQIHHIPRMSFENVRSLNRAHHEGRVALARALVDAADHGAQHLDQIAVGMAGRQAFRHDQGNQNRSTVGCLELQKHLVPRRRSSPDHAIVKRGVAEVRNVGGLRWIRARIQRQLLHHRTALRSRLNPESLDLAFPSFCP